MRAASIGVVLVIVLHAASAAAQPDAALAVDEGIRDDASSGRAWVSPTALTPPAGTFSAQSVELGLLGAGYSITDRLVVSAVTLVPVPGAPRLVIANAKLKVLDLGRLKIAAHANVDYLTGVEVEDDDPFWEGDEERAAGLVMLGGAGTYCLDRGCHSILNAYGSAGYVLHAQGVRRSVPLLGSIAWTQRLGGRVKLLLEVMGDVSVGEIEEAGSLAGWYGVRFAWRSVALDVGLVKIQCDGECDEGSAIGVPWFSVAYRSL